jgi:O-antigen/teichoic acid export membrane protein
MTLRSQIIKGFMWMSIDRFGVQIIQFTIGIFIARILNPEDYGIIGLVAVFLSFSQIFIESGFGKALVQHNKPSDLHYTSVFFFNFVISILFYSAIFIIAPFFADFYGQPLLTSVARIYSTVLIINVFAIIPNSIFSINLNFKPLAISNLVGVILGGSIGLVAALNGCGVWSLVYQTLVSTLIIAIFQWYQSRWIPTLSFSFPIIKTLYKFGKNIFLSSIIDSIVSNISSLGIGKIFDTKSLGYYSKGLGFSNIFSNSIVSLLFTVLFPTFSKIKDDQERLFAIFKKSLRVNALIVIPIFTLISLIAKPLIEFFLTDKWLIAGIILQYLIIARMINVIGILNIQVLHALGHSKLSLKQDIVKTTVRILFLIVTISFGIVWIAIGEVLASGINFFVNTFFIGEIMNFGAIQQIKEIGTIILSSLLATTTSYIVMLSLDSIYSILLIIPIIYLVSFLLSLLILKQEDFYLIKNKIIKILK